MYIYKYIYSPPVPHLLQAQQALFAINDTPVDGQSSAPPIVPVPDHYLLSIYRSVPMDILTANRLYTDPMGAKRQIIFDIHDRKIINIVHLSYRLFVFFVFFFFANKNETETERKRNENAPLTGFMKRVLSFFRNVLMFSQ